MEGSIANDRSAPDIPYEALVASMPQSVRDALPLDRWKIEKLWALDLPISDIPLDGIAWMFELPLWQHDGRRFSVSPASVLLSPALYPAQMERIRASDLSFPIHVTYFKKRTCILDGIHRAAHAALLGHAVISAMRLDEGDLRAITQPE